MNKLKRGLSLFLSICICFSISAPVYATDEVDDADIETVEVQNTTDNETVGLDASNDVIDAEASIASDVPESEEEVDSDLDGIKNTPADNNIEDSSEQANNIEPESAQDNVDDAGVEKAAASSGLTESVQKETAPAQDISKDADIGESAASSELTESFQEEVEPVLVKSLMAAAAKHDYEFRLLLQSASDSDNTLWIHRDGQDNRAVPIRQVKIDDEARWAYCLNEGRGWGASGSEWTTSYNFEITDLPSGDPVAQVQKLVMQLGFGDNSLARLKTLYEYDLSTYEAYQATQSVMWAAEAWVNGGKSGTLKNTLLNTTKIKVPTGKADTSYNFACTLADAVQSVYENGISCSIAVETNSTTTSTVKYKITVTPVNYYGGYTATLSGVPSGATLTSNDSNVTISSASKFSSNASNGTDTLYLTVSRTASDQSLSLTITAAPSVRQYASNSAVAYMSGNALGNNWQNLLYQGGTLSSVSASKTIKLSVPGLPTGQINLQKTSASTTITSGNRQYSLAGAVYGVYSDSACTKQVTTMTTNASGAASAQNLLYGNYWVKEITAPTGYLLNPTVYPASISASNTVATLAVSDTPRNDPIGITLTKISDRPVENAAPLSGAQFTVRYYDGQYSDVSKLPSSATRTWVIETKQVGNSYRTMLRDDYKVSGDEFYYNNTHSLVILPLGTITIQETKAPAGYNLEGSYLNDSTGKSLADENGIVLLNIVSDDSLASGGTIRGGNQYTVENYYLVLETQASFEALPNTGDSTVVIRDEIYYENLSLDKEYTAVGTLMDKDTGETIVGADGKAITAAKTFTPEDKAGYLRYVEFNVPSSVIGGRTAVVFEEVYEGTGGKMAKTPTVVHKDIDDEAQTVIIPGVKTTAVEQEHGAHIVRADGTMTIVDTVTYTNLSVGSEYHLSGVLMDKKTGKPMMDADGSEITSEISFTPKEANGSVALEFTLDASELADSTVVVFEYLYLDDLLVGVHADPGDEDQTVHFPEIRTTALDAETDTHYAIADKNVTIQDEVFYTNLVIGQEYTVSGVLMNKATGEPLLDAEGNEIRSELTFTPEEPDGSVVLSFAFDGSLLAGTTAVAFEDVSYNGVEVATHADLNDEDQTVYFPWIGTTAIDEETGTHTAAADEDVTIVDTVRYTNLEPGRLYTLVGVLMDQSTGKIFSGADTVAVSFTPETASGTVEVEFALDATQLNGHTVVVFESLYLSEDTDAQPVAEHRDIDAEDQSVHFPEIHTTALDAETGTHTAAAGKDVTIQDEVFYTNLVVGQKYTVSGVLMDKETGEPMLDAHGNEIRSEAEFTPSNANGSIVLSFTFDGSLLATKTTVAFERLITEDVEVAVHADLEDEDQSVHFPEIKTTAADAESGTHYAIADKNVTIQDEVFYTNLVIGQEYTVSGILMDKATGKPLLDAEGNEIRAEQTFTPEGADGSIVLPFTFDSSLMAGKTTVAFERLITEGVEVAVHADLEDEDQTVYFPSIGTVAVDSKTGKHTATAEKDMSIVDTVTYTNLEPGALYTLVGSLMDKATGKAVTDANGNPVTSSVQFTPNTTNGTIQVKFSFDGSALGGHTVVVFESLYLGKDTSKQPVAEHKDIHDDAQSVNVTNPPAPHTPKTGDNTRLLPMTLLLLGSAMAMTMLVLQGRRRKAKVRR